jgi:uncharacterized protein (TIGR03083 family)
VPTLAPTPHGHAVTSQDALELLDGEIRRIAEIAADTAARSPIPNVPGWDLAGLIQHTATIHAWVQRMAADLAPRRIDQRPFEAALPDDWAAVPAWYSAAGSRLVATLRETDPDAPMYGWAADRHVRFWVRRMLHETTIHRVDAEAAAGIDGRIEPAVAVDAIDELLDILPYATYFRPQVRELHGDGETIHLHATDLDGTGLPGEWLITLEPDGFRWSHAHVKGAAAVRAGARDLALFAYGRRKLNDPALEVIGETALLTYWSAKSAL